MKRLQCFGHIKRMVTYTISLELQVKKAKDPKDKPIQDGYPSDNIKIGGTV